MSAQEETGPIVYAVVDIETTGLDANLDVPLELGIILTDLHGCEVAAASWTIWESNPIFQNGIMRGRHHNYVNNMHHENGLWHDAVHNGLSRIAVDQHAVNFLKDWGAKPQSRGEGDDFDGLGMMGNSTGSLDRPFSLIHFPQLNQYLGYRNIDMSTVKELVKRHNPALWEQLKPIVGVKADATHRVLDDARACIKEFQTYCDEFLIVGD